MEVHAVNKLGKESQGTKVIIDYGKRRGEEKKVDRSGTVKKEGGTEGKNKEEKQIEVVLGEEAAKING